ncbi:MAG TPA: hypothetical protein VHB25_08480 [Gemmatimonadaceae bacterium]|nr:hypothetical protein [Gemmatimonadaceae bacterium]
MRATNSPPPPAPRYTCAECGLIAPAPIVIAVANPKDDTHGRCSNKQACASRIRRTINKRKENTHA